MTNYFITRHTSVAASPPWMRSFALVLTCGCGTQTNPHSRHFVVKTIFHGDFPSDPGYMYWYHMRCTKPLAFGLWTLVWSLCKTQWWYRNTKGHSCAYTEIETHKCTIIWKLNHPGYWPGIAHQPIQWRTLLHICCIRTLIASPACSARVLRASHQHRWGHVCSVHWGRRVGAGLRSL